jgi:hypothetical protein
MVGLFVAVCPSVFGLSERSSDTPDGAPDRVAVLWPTVYALSFVPFSINNILFETQIKLHPHELILIYFWAQASARQTMLRNIITLLINSN